MSLREPWRGRYLAVRDTDGWEHVTRVRGTAVVGIVALTADSIVLVEQHRPPVGARVLELPAGLVGDDDDAEAPQAAAARELHEETGFVADRWELLVDAPSSAGLTDEHVQLWIARDARREAAGGGTDGEDIAVHVVPLAEVQTFLRQRAAAGVRLDPKLFAALFVAGLTWDGGAFA